MSVAIGFAVYFLLCALGMGLDFGRVLSDKKFSGLAIFAWCVAAAIIGALVFWAVE